jgi:hypothetical protein
MGDATHVGQYMKGTGKENTAIHNPMGSAMIIIGRKYLVQTKAISTKLEVFLFWYAFPRRRRRKSRFTAITMPLANEPWRGA